MNKFEGHTPGPWAVRSGGELVAGPEEGFSVIGGCGCCGSPWVNDDEKANAALIAAAPDLLAQRDRLVAALKVAHEMMQTWHQFGETCPCTDCLVIRNGRALLAEIEGGK